MPEFNLKSRYGGSALITGASSGIGEAFARRIAAEGMDLVLVARRRDRLESLAAELRQKHGVQILVLACDLAEPQSPRQIYDEIQRHGIDLDMLVNNAGYGSYGPFQDLDPDNEARMVDVNCRAPVALTALFAPKMIQRGRGAVVFLSSVAGYQPTPFFATYGATKAFDLMFGEALWAELRPHNIDVITLSPGYTQTEFQQVAKVGTKPVGGWATPEQVVDLCLRRLGRSPSVIHGFTNALVAFFVRITPRKMAAKMAYAASVPGRFRKKT
jgi:short-subunit dehydrogenase